MRWSRVPASLAMRRARCGWRPTSRPDRPTEPDAVLTLVLGASLLGCGLGSWRARPENRLGPVMVLTGFGWFAAQLTEASPPWMNTLGTAVQYLWLIGLLYLLLVVPVGTADGPARPLADGGRRRAAVPARSLAMLDGNKAGLRCAGCPNNLLQIAHDNQEALNLLNLQRLLGAVADRSPS